MSDLPTNTNENKDIDFPKEAKIRTKKVGLATYVILLSVLHVTLAISFAVFGDFIVITLITTIEDVPTFHSEFINKTLEVIKDISIIGTGAIYAIYLLFSLFDSVKHATKLLLGREG